MTGEGLQDPMPQWAWDSSAMEHAAREQEPSVGQGGEGLVVAWA